MDSCFTINVSDNSSLRVNSSALVPEPPKPSFIPPPEVPSQEGPQGILYDFNHGLRIKFPSGDKKWRLTFMDRDTGTVMFQGDVKGDDFICSSKKFFINWRLEVFEEDKQEPLFTHCLDLYGKPVLINFPDGAIGDTIGWFSYMERFQRKHHCRLTCAVPQFAVELFQKQYPDIKLITHKDTLEFKPYATYYMGLFFRGDTQWQPFDFRQVGLHRTAAYILGVDDEDIPPRVDLSAPKAVQEKYCVISTQASSQTKQWNNPFGWDDVIRFLREQGYKVYCINKDRNYGMGLVWNHIPWGVEDATGELSLQERINLIKDADFFIGLGSGMSWLAWCCKVPVVLISGFSLPSCQFKTPYRIINHNVCTGCWDDRREDFDHGDYMWCPRHKGTQRQFECTRMISSQQVINMVRTIPSFRGTRLPADRDLDKTC